jgi:hypothetical protein
MDVSVSGVHRYVRTAAAGRSLDPGRSPGGPRKITAADGAAVRDQVATAPDATLAEPCAAWAAASVATMHRALRRLGLTRKLTVIATERDAAAAAHLGSSQQRVRQLIGPGAFRVAIDRRCRDCGRSTRVRRDAPPTGSDAGDTSQQTADSGRAPV